MNITALNAELFGDSVRHDRRFCQNLFIGYESLIEIMSNDIGKRTSGHSVFQRGHMKFFPSIEEIKL